MLKTHLSNASKGIFIGLILSIVFSFLNSPSTYMPLSPSSGVGQWMQAHDVHGSLVMLYWFTSMTTGKIAGRRLVCSKRYLDRASRTFPFKSAQSNSSFAR